MNAVTWDQRERIIALLADASADPAVRAVVITATGKGFCAGADLRGAPRGRSERVAGDVARTIRLGAQRLIAAVLDCEKPVIAAVNGTAAGIGAHLAFACDLVLAAEPAKFIEVFVRRGLVPDGGGAYLLPRLVGPQRAKELMFFGDALPAAEAERLGLVNRVVPAEELEKTAREWAERLAAGPDAGARADQAAGERVAGRGPGHGVRRGGGGAGDQYDDAGRERGRGELRGAPHASVPRALAPAGSSNSPATRPAPSRVGHRVVAFLTCSRHAVPASRSTRVDHSVPPLTRSIRMRPRIPPLASGGPLEQ